MSADTRTVTVAITHYNRDGLLQEAITEVLDDPRISEIVVVDDCSDYVCYARLADWARRHDSRVTLRRNEQNIDCYKNKARAVELSSTPWVVLFDSDNILTSEYLDALFALERWEAGTAYLPTFARPEFDYTEFDGVRVTRENVAHYATNETFLTALNTANYVVDRDTYLRAFNPSTNPGTADSIYMNLRWLLQGGTLEFVPGMHYDHRMHDGSHFVQNHTPAFELYKRRIEDQLRGMQ